ncbi:solute carrier family 44 protein member 2, putative [Ichthyophthirius multifiliis]|uniref:Choline transporter-like protein n=1 Tax=Ichthyophthirius multifiliis TaxID=5932 RepID=G0R2H9_ICHMU|nr:solute carrier family 44 protein member 2, putative [Ichthyophthirius multifiliis]EGR28329.1 solute carrier family 44 protein member 2, putative [Ichthyophthirius multifiliis]|eukprot:XP_004027674.1 solute carrier family 44 protein member 2, putative [Ichthyophthirius multifiliis]
MTNTKVVPQQRLSPEEEEQLKNGPINQRECRDLLFCLLFIAACISCIYFFSFGIANGQPKRLIAVYDKSGAACGLDNQSDRKYIYFYIPYYDSLNKKNYFTYNTCVKECPNNTQKVIDCNTSAMPTGSCAENICNLNINQNTVQNILNLNLEQMVCIYETKKLLNRICIPSNEIFDLMGKQTTEMFKEIVSLDTLTQWINDIQSASHVIAASLGIAFGLGLSYMLFLRCFAGFLVWICILIYLAAICGLGYYSYKKYDKIKTFLKTNSEYGNYTVSNQESFQALALIMWVWAGITVFLIYCYRKKISQAIAIIKTTTQFIVEVWSVQLVPTVFTIIAGCWWVFWLFGYVYLYSIDKDGQIKKYGNTIFGQPIHSQFISRLCWSYFFIGLWINAFIQALCLFILASSACIWYFSHGEEGQKHSPVSTSIYRAFRYHLGSLAFGSFILAIVQFIRVILAYIEQQMKNLGQKQNKLVVCLVKCLQCYMGCFERFIKFLNEQAYIQIALVGKSFCSAAKDGLSLVWCNADRFSLVYGIGGAFIFVGKIFISGVSVIICHYILDNVQPYSEELNSQVLPLLVKQFIYIYSFIYFKLKKDLFFLSVMLLVQFSCRFTVWVCKQSQYASFGMKKFSKNKLHPMLLLYYKNSLTIKYKNDIYLYNSLFQQK